MKKILLYFCAVFLFTAQFNAQSCTPGANFADSTYGIWPDTSTNFPLAEAGVGGSPGNRTTKITPSTVIVTGYSPVYAVVPNTFAHPFSPPRYSHPETLHA